MVPFQTYANEVPSEKFINRTVRVEITPTQPSAGFLMADVWASTIEISETIIAGM